MFAELMEELNEMSLQPFRPAQRYSGPGDVECDVCIGRKCKAVKSCLECLNSYCQNHLEQHEFFFQVNRHNLMEPTRRLHEMICPKHKKYLEIYCRTDQKCICYPCTMDDHKNHETVTVAAERTEKQRHLRETQRNFQQRIQEREDELQDLRETVRSHQRSAQTAIKDNESFFNELIRSIKKTRSEVTRLIRDQEKTAVSQAEELLKQLEQEIDDLKRRDAELEQLSHTEDLIQFLQRFQFLSAAPESTVSYNIADSSLLSFVDVGKSFSQLKETIENLCTEEIESITGRVSNITIVRPNKPKTRKEFLQYFHQFTLDFNTANKHIYLYDYDRGATYTDAGQQYPDHPDRFKYWRQVLCKESVTGRCYWEVEWSGSNGVLITVSYKTITKGSKESESLFGHNNQSWSVNCFPSNYSTFSSSHHRPIMNSYLRASYASAGAFSNQSHAIVRSQSNTEPLTSSAVNNSLMTKLPVSSSCSRIGVFVDHRAGTLSFYSVSHKMDLIHRVHTTFTQPLYPGFTLFKGATVMLVGHHTE